MTRFRPCIDLHDGQVKQIVGSSLKEATDAPARSTKNDRSQVVENFVSDRAAEWYAAKYASDGLDGGHVIKLGPGNDGPARAALTAYPGGLQVGGGVTLQNATCWLDLGASHVIVTSWLFDDAGVFLAERLEALVDKVGARRLVIDLSCKRTDTGWTVAMNRWQTLTDLVIDNKTLDRLANSCDEFLIHAADVEGLCQGIDADLVRTMGAWGKIPMTYAGGVATMDDVKLVDQLSGGRVDVTVGSALDLFGGSGISYESLLSWNKTRSNPE